MFKVEQIPIHLSELFALDASRYGYIDVVMLLVESGADPTASSKDDKIPLSCAAKGMSYELILLNVRSLVELVHFYSLSVAIG